jgi:hypothetical protein
MTGPIKCDVEGVLDGGLAIELLKIELLQNNAGLAGDGVHVKVLIQARQGQQLERRLQFAW